MRLALLVFLLLLSGAAAQNETDDNDTAPADPPEAARGDIRIAASLVAVVALVAAFVYLARR